MDPIGMVLRPAWDADRELVANTKDLAAPTRCTEWNTGALINHMVADNVLFAALAGGNADFGVHAQDLIGDDPLQAFEQAVKSADAALSEPGALDRPFAMPWGEVPGRDAIGMLVMDMVVHGLDLAHATAQPAPVLERLADGLYEQAKGSIDDSWRGPGKPFAAEVEVPDDAPAHKKLLAYLGRQP